MKEMSRRMAVCGMLTALTVVLMLLGSVFGVLVYACPVMAALAPQYVREEYGPRYGLALYGATGLIALMLIPDLEMSAFYLGFAGWYPLLRPVLERLPFLLRWVCKLAVFNGVMVVLYRILLAVMGADRLGLGMGWELVVALALGNVVFLTFDRMLATITPQRLKILARKFRSKP